VGFYKSFIKRAEVPLTGQFIYMKFETAVEGLLNGKETISYIRICFPNELPNMAFAMTRLSYLL
jgi:hypothetical protein